MIDYDLELQRHNDVLRRAYAIRTSDRALDIGCGTGQTTREAAQQATTGSVLGIDRSNEMIERARELTRAAGLGNVEYSCADAERHELPRESFDVAISRFGTMFFEHPLAAFSNIRSALHPEGRLVMMVWQPRDRNEWATAIESAFPPDDTRVENPTTPPAFSLGAPDFVRRILDAAGFAAPIFEEVHEPVFYGTDVDAAFEFVSGFSTVQEKVARLGTRQREQALDRLRSVLTEHQRADGVWLDSRAWIVTARRG
ncbi:class I SAM-dependent methyltransferase [Lysobacter antibioticus]|uniref:Methyltransferase domain protein n=1 Tax=Lysobacter antibioticus TaxID=84531 RepID=A0A0S2FHV1_LYSAN|nr:class I SAM-dependent methyltransferase [Lysobacter antibioticus]ALN83156.1 methyltransferase domain protein [Lysobacter antibioticus]